ncbi:hypothetical protein PR048_003152 [Dryococelus australis]|uniref:Uncharacterized protein n=1 Tax=Dryococelus australis TaxID=614101 RepID=A0ABQ9IMU2_9NEOP|nr:hypothetical protein PR048_003152 [Dryococelus australis]
MRRRQSVYLIFSLCVNYGSDTADEHCRSQAVVLASSWVAPCERLDIRLKLLKSLGFGRRFSSAVTEGGHSCCNLQRSLLDDHQPMECLVDFAAVKSISPCKRIYNQSRDLQNSPYYLGTRSSQHSHGVLSGNHGKPEQGLSPVLPNASRRFEEAAVAWRIERHASHQGESGSIPGGIAPEFSQWESCRMMPLVGEFPWASPVTSILAFWRCSILTSFQPHRLSRLNVKSPQTSPQPHTPPRSIRHTIPTTPPRSTSREGVGGGIPSLIMSDSHARQSSRTDTNYGCSQANRFPASIPAYRFESRGEEQFTTTRVPSITPRYRGHHWITSFPIARRDAARRALANQSEAANCRRRRRRTRCMKSWRCDTFVGVGQRIALQVFWKGYQMAARSVSPAAGVRTSHRSIVKTALRIVARRVEHVVITLTGGVAAEMKQPKQFSDGDSLPKISGVWRTVASIGMQGGGGDSRKTNRPAASSGTIPTCKNQGVARAGIEPGAVYPLSHRSPLNSKKCPLTRVVKNCRTTANSPLIQDGGKNFPSERAGARERLFARQEVSRRSLRKSAVRVTRSTQCAAISRRRGPAIEKISNRSGGARKQFRFLEEHGTAQFSNRSLRASFAATPRSVCPPATPTMGDTFPATPPWQRAIRPRPPLGQLAPLSGACRNKMRVRGPLKRICLPQTQRMPDRGKCLVFSGKFFYLAGKWKKFSRNENSDRMVLSQWFPDRRRGGRVGRHPERGGGLWLHQPVLEATIVVLSSANSSGHSRSWPSRRQLEWCS